ncbi:MAG TPA: hypothetical protein VJC17_04615 [Candidatus Dojkabacteria bacterium]|nr:hypothetical protein [Candidatus Dojkabacteria bacterium]
MTRDILYFSQPIVPGFQYFDQGQNREVAVLVSDSDAKTADLHNYPKQLREFLLTQGPCSKCIEKIPCAIQVRMAPSTNHNLRAEVPFEESHRPAIIGRAEQILGPNCLLKNQYTLVSI